MQVYGADKVWRQPVHEDQVVARCTVERLMRCLGLRKGGTTSDAKASCSLDGVNRQFSA